MSRKKFLAGSKSRQRSPLRPSGSAFGLDFSRLPFGCDLGDSLCLAWEQSVGRCRSGSCSRCLCTVLFGADWERFLGRSRAFISSVGSRLAYRFLGLSFPLAVLESQVSGSVDSVDLQQLNAFHDLAVGQDVRHCHQLITLLYTVFLLQARDCIRNGFFRVFGELH